MQRNRYSFLCCLAVLLISVMISLPHADAQKSKKTQAGTDTLKSGGIQRFEMT